MKTLTAILLSLALWTPVAFSQEKTKAVGNASISGYITTIYGQGINGMYVCLRGPYNTPGPFYYDCTYTYASGYYSFYWLRPGYYMISVQGYGRYYSDYVYIFSHTWLNLTFR